MQRPLPDNTQHTQKTDSHASGGIRTHNPGKRATADPRFTRSSPWDQPLFLYRSQRIILCDYTYLNLESNLAINTWYYIHSKAHFMVEFISATFLNN